MPRRAMLGVGAQSHRLIGMMTDRAKQISHLMQGNKILASRQDIPVGVLFSRSGHLSVVEKSSISITLFAIDEINRQGGIGGRQITPFVMDAKSDIRTYADSIGRLISNDGVFCTFAGYTSASRRAMLPTVIAKNHLLYLPTCWEGKECVQNIIYTGPVANQHSIELIPYMVKTYGPRCFFIGSNYVWPKESNAVARIWMQQAHGEVIGETYIELGTKDLKSSLAKISDLAPDFIFSTLVGDSATAFYQQYRKAGFTADRMPIASLTTSEVEVKAMGNDAGNGHILAAPYFQSIDNPTNRRFVEAYFESPHCDERVTHFNLENTYLSVYAFKLALELALRDHDWDEITPRLVREVSAGLVLEEELSPEGKVWIHPDNFGMAFIPKIGICQADGQFSIIRSASSHVPPDPYALYPERGICRIDGLHTPDGVIIPNAMY